MFQKAVAVFIKTVYMKVMETAQEDVRALIEEKYGGNTAHKELASDLARLKKGEPLAYVIGHIPFLGLRINLDSHPLIPRPETEWWTELLIQNIAMHRYVSVLDLCAGSGAIGLAVLKHCPNTHVSFGELTKEHEATIRKNIEINDLDTSRADIRIGDLFAPFLPHKHSYDVIASNPPYIPEKRSLDESVSNFEPHEALFSGADGLSVIKRILAEAPLYLKEHGELWMECDIENIEEAEALAKNTFTHTKIHTDQYGRPRVLVAQL